MTDYFEIRVEKLESKRDEKNHLHLPRKSQWQDYSNSGVVESREESSVDIKAVARKCCKLQRQYKQTNDNCNDQKAIISKYMKKMKGYKTYKQDKKELNTCFE